MIKDILENVSWYWIGTIYNNAFDYEYIQLEFYVTLKKT